MDGLLDAIEEMIYIGKESGVKVHISHLKAYGVNNWGKSQAALDLINKGYESGLQISFDQNPYTAGNTFLKACIPGWSYEGGEKKFRERLSDKKLYQQIREEAKKVFESRGGKYRIQLCSIESNKYKIFEGKFFDKISKQLNMEPIDAVLELLRDSKTNALAIYHIISEQDVVNIMRHPLYTVGSDGLVGNVPHPRAYGTFPRIYSKYVLDEKILTLEEAVGHMTNNPAKVLGLNKRGRIEKDFYADLCVLDLNNIQDLATYSEPRQYPTGIDYVVINGDVIIKEGNFLGKMNGKLLRRMQ